MVDEDWIKEQLNTLHIHKSTSHDGVYLHLLRVLTQGIARPVSTIFNKSWCTEEVLGDSKKANVTAVFRKYKQEDPGNSTLDSITSIPGKAVEQLIL